MTNIYEPITLGLGMSDQSTMLYGYGNKRYTLRELEKKGWARKHPELRRRHLAMFFSHPGTTSSGTDALGRPILHSVMGSGDGVRSPGPQLAEFKRRHSTSPTGGKSRTYQGKRYYLRRGMSPMAPPGSSNHEDGTLEGYGAACDMVGWQDHWSDKNCEKYGLKNFGGAVGRNVNNEEWHTQLIEYGNSKSSLTADYRNGKRHKLWSLPVFGPVKASAGAKPAPPECDCDALKPQPVKAAAAAPADMSSDFHASPPRYGLYPFNTKKPTIAYRKVDTAEKIAVTDYLQAKLNANGFPTTVDGDFGKKTTRSVKAFQKANGLKADGIVGAKTWKVIDSLKK